jgi:hypothetical protein
MQQTSLTRTEPACPGNVFKNYFLKIDMAGRQTLDPFSFSFIFSSLLASAAYQCVPVDDCKSRFGQIEFKKRIFFGHCLHFNFSTQKVHDNSIEHNRIATYVFTKKTFTLPRCRRGDVDNWTSHQS